MDLHEWIASKKLDVVQEGNVYIVDGKRYLHVHYKDGVILKGLDLILSEQEKVVPCDYYLFRFGDLWYYTKGIMDVEFNEWNYLGRAKLSLPMDMAYLGIHSGYDLCSGSRRYSEWLEKAKFLGLSKIGICEKHTLAGVVYFQQECEKAGITPVIGETITVKGDTVYEIKLYVENQVGWRNLLNIHKILMVDNKGESIPEVEVIKRLQGLKPVIGSQTRLTNDLVNRYKQHGNVAYQFDTSEYMSASAEAESLTNLQQNYTAFGNEIPFVLITDSYYLDKEHASIKQKLHRIDGSFHHSSKSQYFKAWEEYYLELYGIIKNDQADIMFQKFRNNTVVYTNNLGEFRIKIKEEFYLPEYVMDWQEEEFYDTKENSFWGSIESGLQHYKIQPTQEVLDRIEKEMSVINKGGFMDYFMILADIIQWAKSQGILVGIGRGSVGGSLVAYLLGITSINPLEHGLMFERFLNEGRIGKSLPDIDVDFQASRRDEVKAYMEQRYGKQNVCSIGTYGTFKVKGALKDLGRLYHLTPQSMNYLTAIIDTEGKEWKEIFQTALRSKAFKKFVDDNMDLINDVRLILNQPKTASIHAAGVVITPSYHDGNLMSVWDWLPVREQDGMLISEWEGTVIEDTGFLKEDILGLKQLNKFSEIYARIEARGEKVKNWQEYDYEDQRVMKYFKKGYNQDVFQFQGDGMAGFSRDLSPDSMEELIAMNALYRPGAMDSNAHMDFVDLKNGRKRPYYDFMLEAVTKPTQGLYIYQEQIMQAVQVLGGFNLNEADDIRKAMGKKLADKMEESHVKFVNGAIQKGCPPDEAEKIWHKLEVFSGYGFNKAHAAAYAKMGYVSQWLKVYYPLEFWSVSLKYSDSENIAGRLSELHNIEGVNVAPPDINKSGVDFEIDYQTREIFWSLTKISQVGEVVVQHIVDERQNGEFQSLQDAFQRLPKSKVNKQVMYHLIYSGSFDKLHGIHSKNVFKRYELCQQLSQMTGEPMPENIEQDWATKNHHWINKQKAVSGLGIFDYRQLIQEHTDWSSQSYIKDEEIYYKKNLDRMIIAVGIVVKNIKRKSKNGEFLILTLEGNSGLFTVIVWTQTYTKFSEELDNCEGNILAVTGQIKEDKYHGGQNVQTNLKSKVAIINV